MNIKLEKFFIIYKHILYTYSTHKIYEYSLIYPNFIIALTLLNI